jgi:hypothetical protein
MPAALAKFGEVSSSLSKREGFEPITAILFAIFSI